MEEKYRMSGDTIIIIEGLKHADKYINSAEMVIQGNQILYLKDKSGGFDTTQTMKVKFNKLKE